MKSRRGRKPPRVTALRITPDAAPERSRSLELDPASLMLKAWQGDDAQPLKDADGKLEPRIYPYRADVAASFLRGIVNASRFIDPSPMRVVAPSAPLKASPSESEPLASHLLHGERFAVYADAAAGWVWGQSLDDAYVGYVPRAALAPDAPPSPSHAVIHAAAFIFDAPDIKRRAAMRLSMGARVAVAEKLADEKFVRIAEGGYVLADALAPLNDTDAAPLDPLVLGGRLLGSAYLWGGRASVGLDCSAFVQIPLALAAKRKAPRDSDLLERIVGDDFDLAAGENLGAGDLVFWKGHVGIMRNDHELMHASTHSMSAAAEPFRDAVKRINDQGGGLPTSFKRLRI